MKNVYSIMSNLPINSHLKLISKKWTSIQEAMRLIHDTKHSKDSQLQNLKLPELSRRNPSWKYDSDMKPMLLNKLWWCAGSPMQNIPYFI